MEPGVPECWTGLQTGQSILKDDPEGHADSDSEGFRQNVRKITVPYARFFIVYYY